MSKRTIMVILVILATLAGFVMANNILGTRIRTITVRDGDALYVEPSVTVMSATSIFHVGEELLVLDKLELNKPTAIKMVKSILLEDAEHTKYKLEQGAVYKLSKANLDKPAAPCLVQVKTKKGLMVELEVPKDAAVPVDEGT
ncbi:MAG: hypothetical protein UHM56_02945 [Phascolarctobacterium sp.]|nr:hypothetical protein [Phascolarctobacterium sp.]